MDHAQDLATHTARTVLLSTDRSKKSCMGMHLTRWNSASRDGIIAYTMPMSGRLMADSWQVHGRFMVVLWWKSGGFMVDKWWISGGKMVVKWW